MLLLGGMDCAATISQLDVSPKALGGELPTSRVALATIIQAALRKYLINPKCPTHNDCI